MNNRLINTKVAAAGGCTDIVDNYDPFGGNGVALYQLNGNANDVSGNYDGTATNVTYGTGVFGQAGVFNGSSSYVQLPYTINYGTSDYTVSFWFKISNNSVNQSYFSTYDGVGLMINQDASSGRLRFYADGGTLVQLYTDFGSITTNTWHNAVCTMSHNSSAKLYLNGQLQDEINGSNLGTNNGSNATISKYPTGAYYVNGLIDQVRIFNTALTPLEIEALYTEELCICDGTVDTLDILGDGSCIATYQLDGNANDLSGNYSGTPTDVSYGVGEFDLAGVFNGSSSYVNLPAYFSNPNTNSSTLSIWFKSNINDGNLRTLFDGRIVSGDSAYDIYTINGILRFSHENLGGTGNIDGTTTVTDGNWHNIAIVLNNSTGALNIYLDGNTSSAEITFNFTANSSLNLFGRNTSLGYKSIASIRYWNGSIDQVRIFNKALNSSEVTTLYNETACTKAACTGTTNTLDILGDGSCIATYTLDGSPADLSGNYNGVQTDVTYPLGEFDLAGAFNGTSSKVSTSTYGLSGNASYSASLWFNLGDTSGDQVLYSFGNTVAYQGSSLYIRNNNQIYHANNANADFFTSVPTLSAGVWYHFVLTYSSGSLTAYINNSSIGTVPISTGVLNITGNLGRIGCDIYDNNFLNGQIDQVRIFNKALSAGEVTTLYNETPCN